MRAVRLAVAATVVAALGLMSSPAASARASTEQVLYSFAGLNGAGPLSGVSVGAGGVLYGTTVFGGAHGGGCVFTLTPDGSGYTERILFSFRGNDGAKPAGNVVADAQGDLFGATAVGGADNVGTVFELVRNGTRYTEKVLYSFTGLGDGQEPIGSPVLNASGDVFGVTQFGGEFGQGVVYEVTPSAAGYTEKVLHNFAGTAGQPQAGLTRAADGTLYGTLYGFSSVNQYGSVFSLRLGPSGPVYTDLYNFRGGADAANPLGTVTIDSRTGVIYGGTQYGGTGHDGAVFSLTPSGSGYTESVLYSFADRYTGVLPEGPLLLTANGDLFGTADISGGGCSGIGCGTVFKLTPSGSAYAFHRIYHFGGPPDGAEPQWSGVTAGPGGELFGTTRSGGTSTTCSDGGPGGVSGCGTVYELTP